MARQREPFAPVDAAWLRMEDSTNLMMITGVMMFHERIDPVRLRSTLAERLVARYDRFRKRAVQTPSGGSPAVWEDDPHFSIDAHLHYIALPAPGDQHALHDLVSDMMSTPLDFSKPLWQFHLVDGYGKGCALVVRIHHSIADGIALVSVLLSMTDNDANPHTTVPAAIPEIRHDPRSPIESLVRQANRAAKTAESVAERVVRESQELFTNSARAGELAAVGADGLAALGKLLLMSPDPKTILKGRLGVRKIARWSQPIPLDEVRRISKVSGGTINDVVLAAVAGALRRYLIERGTAVDGLNLRAVVPVNLRPLDRPPTLGNQFGVVFLPLPIGMADPYDRLVELRERMELIKHSPEAIVAFGILTTMGRSPAQLQDIAVGMFGSKATAVMTNVPGPRDPIYMAGASVDQIMFWVPQSGRLGLGVSILSYAGKVMVGVAVDAGLIPDPDRIIAGFHDELELLDGLVKHPSKS